MISTPPPSAKPSTPARAPGPGPGPATGTRACCVVLRPADGQAASKSPILGTWLNERGFTALEVNDPLNAMAAVCLIERTQALRSAWGLPRVEPLAMVVVEPAHWIQFEELLAAMQRFVPDAGVWRLHGEELVPVRKPRIAPAVLAPSALRPSSPVAAALQSEPAAASSASSPPPPPPPVLALTPASTRSEPLQETATSPADSVDDDLLSDASDMVRTLRIALPAAAPSNRAARLPNPSPPSSPPPSASAPPSAQTRGASSDEDAVAADDANYETEPVRITRDELAMLLDEHFDSAETDSP